MLRVAPAYDAELGENIDWRLEQMDNGWDIQTKAVDDFPVFDWRDYQAPSKSWDHDHCVGCGTKFMENGVYETLASGWATGGSAPPLDESSKADVWTHGKDGSALLAAPKWTASWLCNDCHRILEDVRHGRLKIEMVER